jgi:anti-anti-sigma regulatory factor
MDAATSQGNMQLEQHVDHTALLIRGPVRLGEVPNLLEHARAASARGLPVTVDLSEAEHLHSAAWQVLIALERDLQRRGLRFTPRTPSPQARAMLDFLELGRWASDEKDQG